VAAYEWLIAHVLHIAPWDLAERCTLAQWFRAKKYLEVLAEQQQRQAE
jgi:hypothetical protein